MGSTRWSDDHYSARVSHRAATGTPTFKYDDDVKRGVVDTKVHDTLNPKGVTNRESCDSDTHPKSRAVGVLFDVTGSMSTVPKIIQKNLPQLMGLLLRKGYLDSPHILIGAIGDATCDKVPLQVGQFEAGIEIENDLTNLFLEGGGGGHITESYELAMYFMARHTKIDCFDKRSEKGYLFIIGDEIPYPKIKREEVERITGDTLQADIPVEEIVSELEKRYEVYYILPNMTSNYGRPEVFNRWKELLGQKALKLEDPAGVSELIASTIGLCEGKIDMEDIEGDLADAGSSKAIAKAVSSALVKVEGTRAVTKRAKGTDIAVPESGASSGVATL